MEHQQENAALRFESLRKPLPGRCGETIYVVPLEEYSPFTRLKFSTNEDEVVVQLLDLKWSDQGKNISDSTITCYIRGVERKRQNSKWKDVKSLTTRLFLLQSGELSDVVFMVGAANKNRKCFQAHRFYLATVSNSFREMFYKGHGTDESIIEIRDIDPDTFHSLLHFIYISKLKVESVQQAIKLYFASVKFDVRPLMTACRSYINDHVSTINVCHALEFAMNTQDRPLLIKCKRIIAVETSDVLRSDAFMEAPSHVVMEILNQKALTYESEIFLFWQLWRWSWASYMKNNHQANVEEVRKVMEPMLPYISFLSMPIQGFINGPRTSGIMTQCEISQILENIKEFGSKELPYWCSEVRRSPSFPLRSWHQKWRTTWTCQSMASRCNVSTKPMKQFGYIGAMFEIKWRDITLHDMLFYVQPDEELSLLSTPTVTVRMLTDNTMDASRLKGTVSYDYSTDMCRLTFINPPTLTANHLYCFIFHPHNLFGSSKNWNCCGNALEDDSYSIAGVEFVFHDFRKYENLLIITHPHELMFKVK